MTAIGCPQFSEMAPDVALGLLSGHERAQALDHLAQCPTCREHVEGLIRVADGLLLLAPMGEPPIGFESRVMARLAGEGAIPVVPNLLAPASAPAAAQAAAAPQVAAPSSVRVATGASPTMGAPTTGAPTAATTAAATATSTAAATTAAEGAEGAAAREAGRRRGGRDRRRWASPAAVLTAAVVIVVAGFVGVVAGRTSATHSPPAAVKAGPVQAVEVRADDGSGTCRLVAFAGRAGRPAELVIHLDEPGEPPGTYSVVARPTSGQPEVSLGTIEVRDGQGLLDVTVPAGTGPVNGVRILESGHLHYQANFTSV